MTGLKALNVNLGFVSGFAELKKAESGKMLYKNPTGALLIVCIHDADKLLDFFSHHIHSADDHLVRWKWTVGAVAMWDNRCVIHRVIPGSYKSPRRGIRTTVFSEKRKQTRPINLQCSKMVC